MGRFEVFEHTADVGIRGWGSDLPELFAAMGRGLFAVIADPDSVHTNLRHPLHLESDSLEDLLHEWLDELNAFHQIHGELYGAFTVNITGNRLEAMVEGEAIDHDRHGLRVEVKAVTWHDLRIEKTADGYEAFVLLDI